MARRRKNMILAGKKSGDSIAVRGYFVRMKIWHTLVNSSEPLKTIDVVERTSFSYEQVKSWLDVWVSSGYVKRARLDKSPTGGKRFTHEAVYRTEHPPAIDLKGNAKPVEHRQLIWDAIRQHKALTYHFTSRELQYAIEATYDILVNHEYVVSYLWDLYRAGYLQRQSVANSSSPTVYSLVYDTGVYSPSLCRGNRVFDANLGVLVT